MYMASTFAILESQSPLSGLSNLHDTTHFPCEEKSGGSDQKR